MKKLFILIFALFVLTISAFAKNTPRYSTSINIEGIGIIKLPQQFNIYEKPDAKSKIITEYKWGEKTGAYVLDEDYSDNFVVMDVSKNLAFMTVVDDTEEGGWYKVCYDQKNKLTGWVSPDNYEFYSWTSFFTKYGKLNGLYFFEDIPFENKKLYSQPDTTSQVINTFSRIKTARVQFFKGDWVLLRTYDYEGNIKIGWFKWRTEDGKFYIFPRIK